MNRKKINTLYLKTLTPVHVSSGKELINGFDIVKYHGDYVVLDIPRLMEFCLNDDNMLKQLSNAVATNHLEKFIEQRSLSKEVVHHNIHLPDRFADRVYAFIRDKENNAFIPGSVMKNTLTILLYLVLGNHMPPVDKNKRLKIPESVKKFISSVSDPVEELSELFSHLFIADSESIINAEVYRVALYAKYMSDKYAEMIPDSTITHFQIYIIEGDVWKRLEKHNTSPDILMNDLLSFLFRYYHYSMNRLFSGLDDVYLKKAVTGCADNQILVNVKECYYCEQKEPWKRIVSSDSSAKERESFFGTFRHDLLVRNNDEWQQPGWVALSLELKK